jgi:hypothetical protein
MTDIRRLVGVGQGIWMDLAAIVSSGWLLGAIDSMIGHPDTGWDRFESWQRRRGGSMRTYGIVPALHLTSAAEQLWEAASPLGRVEPFGVASNHGYQKAVERLQQRSTSGHPRWHGD